MKIFCVLLVVSVVSQGCTQKIFEGRIKYVVKVDLHQENHPWNNYLLKKWGDTLVVYHNVSGSYKKKYLGAEPLGFDWNIYNHNTNSFYSKYHSMDTVFYYDCSTAYFNLVSFSDGAPTTVNGQQYPSIVLELAPPKDVGKVTEVFSYDSSLRLNPKHYANFNDGFLNKIYQKSKSHFIQWSLEEEGLYKVTFTAVEVMRQKVEVKQFEFDKTLPTRSM